MDLLPSLLFQDFDPGLRYVVAVSAGADSLALLHLLREAGFENLHVCHVNHQLRGAAADADAAWLEQRCAEWGLDCEVRRIEVAARVAACGESLEQAARTLRLGCYVEAQQRQCAEGVFLGHHGDDQAETLLLRLLRGAHGLGGMRAVQRLDVAGQELRLFRPLLGVRRQDLRDFLLKMRQSWREDASNAVADVWRNRLRLQAMPLLADIAQRDITPLLLRQVEAQQALLEVQQWAVANSHCRDPQGRLHLGQLRVLPRALQAAVLHAYLVELGIAASQRDIAQALTLLEPAARAPAINLPGNWTLRRRAGRLLAEKIQVAE